MDETARAALIRRYRQIEFRGILSINKPVTLPLTEFYVPLQATQSVVMRRHRLDDDELRALHAADAKGDDLLKREFLLERRETRTLAVADALGTHRALVVLGDPGAGKSTLLRALALAAAEQEPERMGLPAQEQGWIPLLVPCAALDSALQAQPASDPLNCASAYLAEHYQLAELGKLAQAALAQGRALLLFDGLDEVFDSAGRSEVARAIDALLPVLTAAYRTHGIPEPAASAAAFLHDVQHYSGLLVERGPDQYSFLHLTFQKYFAARALAVIANPEARWRRIEPHLSDPRWRETILLTAGELGIRIGREDEVTDLVKRIHGRYPKPTNQFQRRQREHVRDYSFQPDTHVARIEERILRRRLLLAGDVLADDVGVAFDYAVAITDDLIALSFSPIRPQSQDALVRLARLPLRLRQHATGSLCETLHDVDRDVRQAAAEALEQLGGDDMTVRVALRETLRDTDKNVRRAAAQALVNAKDCSRPARLTLLVALMDTFVHNAVYRTLIRSGEDDEAP